MGVGETGVGEMAPLLRYYVSVNVFHIQAFVPLGMWEIINRK